MNDDRSSVWAFSSWFPEQTCISFLFRSPFSLPSLSVFLLALLVLLLSLLVPHPTFATGTGPDLGLQSALIQVRKFLTGPVVTAAATVAMVGVLYGIIIRSQRGESISSLAAIACALILITNIQELMDLIGASAGASMSPTDVSTLSVVVLDLLPF